MDFWTGVGASAIGAGVSGILIWLALFRQLITKLEQSHKAEIANKDAEIALLRNKISEPALAELERWRRSAEAAFADAEDLRRKLEESERIARGTSQMGYLEGKARGLFEGAAAILAALMGWAPTVFQLLSDKREAVFFSELTNKGFRLLEMTKAAEGGKDPEFSFISELMSKWAESRQNPRSSPGLAKPLQP